MKSIINSINNNQDNSQMIERITDRIEGRMDAEKASAFDLELTGNEELAEEYALMDALLSSLGDLDADTAPSADFHQNLMAKLRLESEQTERKLVSQMMDNEITRLDADGNEDKNARKGAEKRDRILSLNKFKRRVPLFTGLAAACVLVVVLFAGLWNSGNKYGFSGSASQSPMASVAAPRAPMPAPAPAASAPSAAGGSGMRAGVADSGSYDMAMSKESAANATMMSPAPAPPAMSYVESEKLMADDVAKARKTAENEGGIVAGGSGHSSQSGQSDQSGQIGEQKPVEQKIIRNGNINLEVDKYDGAVAAIKAMVATLGGYVTSENSYLIEVEPERKSGSLSIKIPFNNYESMVGQASTVGKVLQSSVWSEDVTAQYIDLSARINVYEIKYQRLLALLEKSGELETILAVENELANANAELESLKGQMRYLLNRTDYSTLDISITEKRVDLVQIRLTGFGGFAQRVGESFNYGTNALIRGLGDRVIWLAGNLAGFAFVAALILLVWILWLRRLLRKRKEKSTL